MAKKITKVGRGKANQKVLPPPFRAQTSNALMAAQNSRSTNNSLTNVNVTTVNRFLERNEAERHGLEAVGTAPLKKLDNS